MSGSGNSILTGILSIFSMTLFTDNLLNIVLHTILRMFLVVDDTSSSSPPFPKAYIQSSFFQDSKYVQTNQHQFHQLYIMFYLLQHNVCSNLNCQ